MSFYFGSNGNVQYAHGYVHREQRFRLPSASVLKTDGIRQQELYVESAADVEAGHIVLWTGDAAMFLSSGQKLSQFDGDHGHEYAISSVALPDSGSSHLTDVAGVVIETAATPTDSTFLHKSVHSRHPIRDNQHILRISRPGSCALAWVITDAHENVLNGVYQQFVNGVPDGTFVIRELGTEYFTIEEINPVLSDVSQQVQDLTDRLDMLTADN